MASPRDYLAFRLWGPTASWGSIAVGEQRHTWTRPSRSSVLGLVAAALGYERRNQDAHAALERGLGLAVRVDRPGRPLRDYHTTQSPSQEAKRRWHSRYDEIRNAKSLNTILSQRSYLTEPSVVIMLWRRSESETPQLDDIAAALKRPKFTLYLGRKASPLGTPIRPAPLVAMPALADAIAAFDKMEIEALRDARSRYEALMWLAGRKPPPWRVPDLARPADKPPADVWIGSDDLTSSNPDVDCIDGYEVVERSARRDDIRDRRNWTFADRAEVRIRFCAKEQTT